ncbi:MAG: hypothetical protein LBL45_02545, partial [Treponema sp.]|nr:hypothetical protein [Treponema sp.]
MNIGQEKQRDARAVSDAASAAMSAGQMKKLVQEKLMSAVFFLSAAASILALALICFFLMANGHPAIGKIGAAAFMLGKECL